jgi:hypothetical protein
MDTQDKNDVIRQGVKWIFRTDDIKHNWTDHIQQMPGVRYVAPIIKIQTRKVYRCYKRFSIDMYSSVTKMWN